MNIFEKTITPSGDSYTVEWTWPSERNDEISEFLFQFKPENSTGCKSVRVSPDQRMLIIAGLMPYTSYNVKVLAVPDAG